MTDARRAPACPSAAGSRRSATGAPAASARPRGATRVLSVALLSLAAAILAGCAADPQPGSAGLRGVQPATRPVRATDVDPDLAKATHWWDQPANVSVEFPEFEPLWAAAQEAAKDAGFKLDRIDVRAGVLTTKPLVSQQAFELWRRDVASLDGLAESTLATVRRTVRFDVNKLPDGGYRLAPKVLVERYSFAEHRITSVALYREVFALTPQEARRRRNLQENLTEAPGPLPPPDYWYATGRDPDMERRLAGWVHDEVRSHARAAAAQ